MEPRINHWKLTTIGMLIVVITAITTGLVVARWYGPEISRMNTSTTESTAPVAELPPRFAPAASPATEPPAAARPAPVVSAPSPAATAPAASSTPAAARASSTPPKEVVAACNQYAARESGANTTTKAKTIDVVKDAAIGAVGGAAVGALGGAIADGGSGAGKGAAVGGLVGGGAGTLYGIYTNKKNDEKYRAAYSSCMKNRGYTT